MGTQLTSGLGLLILSPGFLLVIPPIMLSFPAHCFEPQVITEPNTYQRLSPLWETSDSKLGTGRRTERVVGSTEKGS